MKKHEMVNELIAGKTLKELIPIMYDGEGEFFKADDFVPTGDIVYIPDFEMNGLYARSRMNCSADEFREMSKIFYTGEDFLRMCGGDSALAKKVFQMCEWQHPSVVMKYEMGIEPVRTV